MTIFVISDTHFGHENMQRFLDERGRRIRREFNSAQEGDWSMIDRWNKVVKPNDHVYHLGDVAMRRESLQMVKQLNGKKRLLFGNHDIFDVKSQREVGFEKFFGSRKLADFLLTHIPVHPESIPYWAKANVHGHTHRQAPQAGKQINVSVERIDYTPVALEELKL